ncbi:ParB N-terminal domain-containing protein [Kribbella sp. NPDC048915]|uniref:ParB N-terminal domain-containing protein n=1 Tax=Kribbella sp. NPDC048915 TaxID=3155148 RepID=UPI0033C20631
MTRLPFPLAVPGALQEYILDFQWDLELLHALELPFWAFEGQPFQLTPRDVAAAPSVYREQYARTLRADLRHPIDVVRRPSGRITILDGVHRLLRASLEGRTTVAVRVLEWSELDRIAVRG